MTSGSKVRAVDVGRTLDAGRWSGYQKSLVLLTALTVVFDGFDNQLLGLALPSIMREWNVAPSAFAPIVSLSYLGMMVGAAAAGVAGDRFGRRVALLGSVLTFGAATVVISIVDTLPNLAACRFLAGVGLGGAIPNAAALAAEFVPMRHRPIAVTLTIVCVPLGGTLAGLFAVPALPFFGWRGMFAIGGVIPVLTALVLIRLLPESPRYLAKHPHRWPELTALLGRMGHAVDADTVFANAPETLGSAAPAWTLVGRDYRVDTFALWTAFFSCLLAVYLGFAWLPSLLTSAGLSPAVASTGLTLFNLGGVVGAIAGGALISRFGSKPTMLTMTAGAAAGAIVLSWMPFDERVSVLPILVMLTITGGLINAVQTTMYALAASVYPTAVRATGVGAAASVGRTGAILSGYAGPWALELRGSASFFGLMAASLCVTLLSLWAVRRHVAPGGRTR